MKSDYQYLLDEMIVDVIDQQMAELSNSIRSTLNAYYGQLDEEEYRKVSQIMKTG